MRYFGWIGTVLFGAVSLFVGLVPLGGTWPGWAFVAVSAVALLGFVLTFPWPTSNGPRSILRRGGGRSQTGERSVQVQGNSNRSQVAKDNAKQIMADGDVYFDGGMGDSRK